MADFLLHNPDLLSFMVLVALGYAAGSIAERRHYRCIERRERELVWMPVVTAEGRFPPGKVRRTFLVSGSVVVSIDYFKRLLAILRNIFGGRVRSYESLVDRARREAVLRLKEDARRKGAGMVVNLRLETAAIGRNANRKRQIGSVEAIAYGTAVVFHQ